MFLRSSIIAELVDNENCITERKENWRIPENTFSRTGFKIGEGINVRKVETVGDAYDCHRSIITNHSASIVGMCFLG